MSRLEGKIAIVTGAGAGIGQATAILFAKEGAKVVVADLDPKKGEETVSMIKKGGGEATFVKADVSQAVDVESIIKSAVDTYDKLDILFNNAGISGEIGPTAECTEENWDKVLRINLKSVFLGMKYAIPEMLKRGGGVIINSASNAAHRPPVGIPAYNASKAGVIALTKTVAMEYLRKNIRINYISPGCTLTPMNVPFEKFMNKQLPLGRLAKPDEIAQAVLFLASDDASFVTASGVIADGGQIAYNPLQMIET